jgi:hypothetical protein
MPSNNPITETHDLEQQHLFEFRNDRLLLPEHTDSDFPESEFFTYGSSDNDLQF